jgi:hypothetical protein
MNNHADARDLVYRRGDPRQSWCRDLIRLSLNLDSDGESQLRAVHPGGCRRVARRHQTQHQVTSRSPRLRPGRRRESAASGCGSDASRLENRSDKPQGN